MAVRRAPRTASSGQRGRPYAERLAGLPTMCDHCGTVSAALLADVAPPPACACACHVWRAELRRLERKGAGDGT